MRVNETFAALTEKDERMKATASSSASWSPLPNLSEGKIPPERQKPGTYADEKLEKVRPASMTRVLSSSPDGSLQARRASIGEMILHRSSTTGKYLPEDHGYPSKAMPQESPTLGYKVLSEERLEIRLLSIEPAGKQRSISAFNSAMQSQDSLASGSASLRGSFILLGLQRGSYGSHKR